MNAEINKQVLRIAQLALEINQSGTHTIFFEFIGHVNWVRLAIHQGEWKSDVEHTFDKRTYLDETNILNEFENELLKCRPKPVAPEEYDQRKEVHGGQL